MEDKSRDPETEASPKGGETPKPEAPAPAAPSPPAEEAAPAAPERPRLSIEQFFELELRVAQIISAERVEKTDKLLKLQIDLGSEKRQIIAGIAQAYETEALIGKRIIVVANLEPARIRGVDSQGMLLAADLDGRPIVATFDEDIPPGTRVR